MRSFKHVLRHVRSGRHVRLTKTKNKPKQEQDHDNDVTAAASNKGPKVELQMSPDQKKNDAKTNQSNATPTKSDNSPKHFNYRSTIIELQKRFSWIESSNKPNYGYCRFCSANIPLKILFLRNHSNSLNHRSCVKSYCDEDKMSPKKLNNEPAANEEVNVGSKTDHDDDVLIVEDNNEEILISEQDENWTVK